MASTPHPKPIEKEVPPTNPLMVNYLMTKEQVKRFEDFPQIEGEKFIDYLKREIEDAIQRQYIVNGYEIDLHQIEVLDEKDELFGKVKFYGTITWN